MARKLLYMDGGTVCHGQDGGKSADYSSMCNAQTNSSISNPRRSLRLKEIAAIYKKESAIPVILSSIHQRETGRNACASSPKLVKEEMPSYDSSQGSPEQKSNADAVDSVDESNTSITLMDLLTRCKIKKRKTFEAKVQPNADIQGHNNIPMMTNEDDIELEKTISSFKVKKAKLSPTSEKSDKKTEPTKNSSMAEKKTVLTCPFTSVASESEQAKETLMETISDELSADSNSSPRHMKGIVDENIKGTGFVIKKEIIEACFNASDAEDSMLNSTTAFVKKCNLDNEYLCDDKVSEKRDLDQPDNVVSNIMDPFLRESMNQCKHEFSSSSAPSRLENFQNPSHDAVNVKNELIIVGSTKCEGTTPNADLLSMFKHHRSLPTDVSLRDDQQELQFKELIPSDNRSDVGLIKAESSTEFIVSDCEKLACFIENDSWLDENRKSSFSDMPFNQRIISLVPELKSSYSFDNFADSIDGSVVSLSSDNNSNFIDGLKHDNIDRNNWSSAIHSHKNLNIVSDGERSMGSGNCAGLVSQSSQPLSTCSFSQVNHNIILSVDTPCLITEAEYLYVNPVVEDEKQASQYDGDSLGRLTATDYMLDGDGRTLQKDKLMPSSQMQKLSRCSKSKSCCAKVSDLTDGLRPFWDIVCLCPSSQQHEIKADIGDQVKDVLSKSATAMDTIADFSTNSSIEFSTQNCVERQINMKTTEIQAADMKIGGNLCMEAGHSPRKLLSNRKEISPKSQEKLLRALSNGGSDDPVKLSNCMKKLCFDKGVSKKPLLPVLDNGETFLEIEQMIKKPHTMNQSLPVLTKGILKSPDTISCNYCCLKNSSIHAQAHDVILFSQRQMQDTENIATKLIKELNILKSIVEAAIFPEGPSSPSKLNVDEIRLATKHASKLEVTTKKWLAMMAKDCTRFCKIMRLAENKSASPINDDIHKGRKKITFADEAGGDLCQIKVYDHQPADFIFPES